MFFDVLHHGDGSWRRAMMLLVMVPVITGCELYQVAVDYRYAPTVQQHPSQLLAISGNNESNLHIQFFVEYETTHTTCGRTINWLSGTKRPRQQTVTYAVPIATPEYSVSIALDHFVPGPCQWRPRRLTFGVTKSEPASVISSRQPSLVLFGFRKTPQQRYYPTETVSLRVKCLTPKSEDAPSELSCFPEDTTPPTISPETKALQVIFFTRPVTS